MMKMKNYLEHGTMNMFIGKTFFDVNYTKERRV